MAHAPEKKVAIIGLGYVGLPLAVEFGKGRPTVGFDTSEARVAELKQGRDTTLEVEARELKAARYLTVTDQIGDIRDCGIYIVTVPTPIDAYKRPDLTALRRASEMIGAVLSKGDIVIFESTVYPGATEEECVPVLEGTSGLTYNTDFFCGYSPERINPGDKAHRLPSIVKVTSGSTPETAEQVDALYRSIITAGTHKAPSIRVAEAAKVIENTQRDINIALVNELAKIFHRMDIDTLDVLEAAGTKWNFLPFRPGLVGGHCIGVDPYYLTHKAESLGYHPEVVLAGRRINDGMAEYVVERVVLKMIENDILVRGAKVLVLGLTFKENCPDLRNSKVIDIIGTLKKYGIAVDVHDPWIDVNAAHEEYGLKVALDPRPGDYDAIILAVAHEQFIEMGVEKICQFGKPVHVLFDVKGILPWDKVDGRL